MLKTKQQKTRHFLYHVFAWAAYSIYYYAVNRLANEDITPSDAAVSVPFYALVCYAVYHILSRYFAKGKYFWGITHLLAFYVAFGLLAHTFVYKIGPHLGIQFYADDVDYSHQEFIQTIVLLLSNYSMFAIAYFFMRRDVEKANKLRIEAERRLEAVEARLAVEKEKQRYEYVALTGQVSPHLQANLLNRWIVLLKDSFSDLAAEIDKAYQIIQYYMRAHTMDGANTVTLKQEVKQLEFYMELFNISGSAKKYIVFEKDTRLAGYSIPPTTLITFFENATKHGIVSNPDKPIQMKIHTDAQGIMFRCTNSISNKVPFVSHGVGLANLKRRLTLKYGNSYQLKYGKTGDAFTVTLFIKT